MSEAELTSSTKKHKKHKSEKREREGSSDRPPGLKLILKVGSQTTPEHNTDWTYPPGYNPEGGQDATRSHHKKSKKKKKKKDKNKDREKKHKHHHKDKKRRKEESNGDGEELKEDDSNKDEINSEANISLSVYMILFH